MVVIDNKKNKEVLFKSNDLIQKIWHSLGIREQQIFALLIKQIQPFDTEFKMQKFTFAQVAKELGWTDGGNTRIRLMTALKNMRKICFWHRSPDNVNKLELCGALGYAAIDVREKTAEMMLDKTLEPYLLGLRRKGNFTVVQFHYVVKANSRFTMPLYEYLRSKAFGRYTWQVENITITELRGLLNAKPSQDWRDFKKYALNVATEEINRITDMTIKYEPNKIGKEIVSVTFYCRHKNNNQNKKEHIYKINTKNYEKMDDEREDLCSDFPDSYYDEYDIPDDIYV